MKKNIRSLCETGILIAASVILEFLFKMIPFMDMPSGGSVSITMLPILLIGYRNGTKYGLIGGVTYGLIDFAIGGYAFHLGSIFFDYIFAYGFLGLSGLFREKIDKLWVYILGLFIPCFIRYLCHSLSGFIFFKANDVSNAYGLFYSFILYNGPYMLISTILCIILSIPLRNLVIGNKNK